LLKWVAVGVTALVLAVVLARIGWIADERQQYQREAVASVQQSHAGAQVLLGPVLQRRCTESWDVTVGEGKERRTETRQRELLLQAAPTRLAVDSDTQTDLRYRGLFKVNGYQAQLRLAAQWAEPTLLQPKREQAGSTLTCAPATLWLAAADVRGLRTATLKVGDTTPAVQPGTGHAHHGHGLHAEVPGFASDGGVPAAPLQATLTLQIVGTAQLALVPVAQHTDWALRSDWPHPSFGGRFLPTQREVNEQGFNARWAVSALATAAPREALQGGTLCTGAAATESYVAQPAANAKERCLDSFAVAFIDPVNPYVLSDRAIKYGLLFVLLTFTAVALTEALQRGPTRRRVHPVQYALVGLALCVFFLLLLSLSEHLAFGVAYGIAAAAVVVLLTLYTRHMLGRVRDGLLFGGGMALLYGLLYVLLLREQTALVIGSIGLFAALAAVMLLTRRLDWYGLGLRARPAAEAAPGN